MNMHTARDIVLPVPILRSALSVAALAMAALGSACTSADAGSPAPSAPPSASPPGASEADAGAPRRVLLEDDGIGTAPTNLLVDPSFRASDTSIWGFLAVSTKGTMKKIPFDLTVDSRSPTGAQQYVAIVSSPNATDATSDPVTFMSSFYGGPGPFEAQVWVSKVDMHGAPVSDIPLGDAGISATLGNPGLPAEAVYDLTPKGAPLVASNGRTWILLHVRVEGPIEHLGFLSVRTGTTGGKVLVAAPSVVAEPLAKGASTRALMVDRAHRRTATIEERSAVQVYLQQELTWRRPPARPAPWSLWPDLAKASQAPR